MALTNKLFGLLFFTITVLNAQDNLRRPSSLQMAWQQMERTAFIHFSINTFTDMEWGYGNESPTLFNPTDLDCDQWIRIFKNAGMTGVILTAKHHDGFCLWPSAYTEHSVKNSPWRKGKGDVVKEVADACKKYGLKFGLYLSPWDCNHPDYGNDKYVTYFQNQLRELLTQYGEIYEIWFDSANGGRGYYSTDSLHNRNIPEKYYAWNQAVEIVRELQPKCIIHGGGISDIRWVGNEEGHAGKTHWSTMYPSDQFPKSTHEPQEFNKGHQFGTLWQPSETDVSIRPGWYYHSSEDHQVKSITELMKIYYESVGRNSVLLLNVPPNKTGKIYPTDSANLLQWEKQIQAEFSNPILKSSDKIKEFKEYKTAPSIGYGEGYSLWENTINVVFKKEETINRIVLQEDITKGQTVVQFIVEYEYKGVWKVLDTQTTIGYKRILHFAEITANKICIKIKGYEEPWVSVSFYRASVLLQAPIITRDAGGIITIHASDPNIPIEYRMNNGKYQLYKYPFKADGKVTIEAVSYGKNKKKSPVGKRVFKYSKQDWKVGGDTDNKTTKILFDDEVHTNLDF
ncbi:MAG: alpha-L-fucosidase [Chitinophagaceae bacterium]